MSNHTCSRCGTIFNITEATRSPARLFKNSGWSESLSTKIELYFIVICPECGNRETSSEIRMFGLFGPKTVLVGLFVSFLVIIIIVELYDRSRQ